MMKKILNFLKRNYFISTPFLIAIYTVLFLYVKNQHEYKLEVLLTPISIALGFTLLVFLFIKLIFRKMEITVVVSSLITFVVLSYGRFLALSEKVSFQVGDFHVGPEIFTGIIVALVFLGVLFLIIKFRNKLHSFCSILFLMVVVLVVWQTVQIALFEIQSGRIFRTESNAPIKTDRSKADASYPDIYYIIPDRYAGARSLQEQYGFDNSKFLTYLEKKGFYVTKNPTTNYPKTFQSLGSSLNMEYLDFLTEQTNGGASKDESIVTPLIENNKVLQFLKDHGYSYVHIGSWWEPTKTNPSADRSFAPRRREHIGADEFTTGFYNTTMFSEFLKTFFKEPSDISETPQNNLHRQAALQQFEELRKIPKIEGPKFVFVHILLPHDPFVFDENCTPISRVQRNKNTHQVNYINQVQCVNSMLQDAIDTILTDSKTPPIIILQSDEGPFPMNSPISGEQAWGQATDTALREKFPIINAYYFPGKEATTSGLYDSITPINSFRVLFNTYFGQNYDLLPDRNYIFQDDNNYYKFIDVTDKVKN